MRAPKNRFWTLALLGVLAAASGCNSRTLPLPPPIVQSLSLPDEDGLVRVRFESVEPSGLFLPGNRFANKTLDGHARLIG
jgi:hypothetical protein